MCKFYRLAGLVVGARSPGGGFVDLFVEFLVAGNEGDKDFGGLE